MQEQAPGIVGSWMIRAVSRSPGRSAKTVFPHFNPDLALFVFFVFFVVQSSDPYTK
jgi:hypothetical protein